MAHKTHRTSASRPQKPGSSDPGAGREFIIAFIVESRAPTVEAVADEVKAALAPFVEIINEGDGEGIQFLIREATPDDGKACRRAKKRAELERLRGVGSAQTAQKPGSDEPHQGELDI